MRKPLATFFLFLPLALAAPDGVLRKQIEATCTGCHNAEKAMGGLDVRALPFNLVDRANRERWVRIHDRVANQEMPPKGVPFAPAARAAMLAPLAKALHGADLADVRKNGRGPMRRMNREEYEQNLRDLLQLPHLEISEMLPEDRQAHHFDKVAETLDMSRVQLTAYLDAAEAALRQAMVEEAAPPAVSKFRAFGTQLFPGARSTGGRESMFFFKDNQGINVEKEWPKPWTPEVKEDQSLEMGLFRSPGWPYGAFPQGFAAKASGSYRVRFEARAVLQQPGYRVTRGTETVPMTFRSRRPTNHDIAEVVQWTGGILEIGPEVKVHETTVYLRKGQTIEYGLLGLPTPQVDAVPGLSGSYRYPPFPAGGQPGIAFRWLEIEGPVPDQSWPPASHQVLFDGLGVKPAPVDAKAEASRLMARFIALAARHAVPPEAMQKFERLVHSRLEQKEPFAEAMLAGYQAFLASGEFLYLRDSHSKGGIDAEAVAERLSHFLTNSGPSQELRATARQGELREQRKLRAEAEALIGGPGFERFVKGFTGQWLNLRQLRREDPDIRIYPEYRLDEYLVDSMEQEARLFFTAMVRENLPIRNLVQADFVFANERLAKHYGLPAMAGAQLQRVELPKGSPLGGVLTQAAILKVTANGTSTSPVLRGAWIMDRILGEPPPPPPPGVPAVEPDLRGAKTIRDLLAMHTKSSTCAACHAKFDPVGLALENFDVMGAWRSHYRGLQEGKPVKGIDPAGHDFAYTVAGPVDASGQLYDGRTFQNVHELKEILAADPRKLARNFLRQLTVYATGTPVRFSDRATIEGVLDKCAAKGYPARELLLGLVESKIFLGEK